LTIFNTMSMQKEVFEPIKPGLARIYVCGPTAYDFAHIGNARPAVVFDTLRRWLVFRGFEVEMAQNITDIDDKIISRANQENLSAQDVAKKYIAEYFRDMEGLNIPPANFHPQVTGEMPEIVAMIGELADNGWAYTYNGSVFFRASKLEEYGKLAKKNIEDLQMGIRVEVDGQKEHPADFVLWKPAKPGEPAWDAPWGAGRPGWHIECSAMARKYLGATVDIHGGGEDLCFPHHENEAAQSLAANGVPLANFWMHNGMITVDAKKMSKSIGNFFTIREICEKYDYSVLRFLILSVHYRSPLSFSEELLESSKAGLARIRNCRRSIDETSGGEGGDCAEFKQFNSDFAAAMDDDLNTANAIAAVFDLVKFVNKNLGASRSFLDAAATELDFMLDILGIEFADSSTDSQISETDIAELIEERNGAKAARDFARADEIRAQLDLAGIVIKDTREGTLWHRS